MPFTSPAVPLTYADGNLRVRYLQRVAAITVLGLFIAGVTGVFSSGVIALVPALQNRLASFVIIMGGMGVANWVAPRFVFSASAPARWGGFLLGTAAEGVALGYLLLTAFVLGAQSGNPLLLVAQAMGLTGLAAAGMTAYLWTSPRDFSMVRAGLAALAIPMLVLMVLSFVFPISGTIGILMSLAFVAMSVGGLLYKVNDVLHRLQSDMYVEGAYTITLGILALFWNILVLLMRLQRR